jgi:hypothetical protein
MVGGLVQHMMIEYCLDGLRCELKFRYTRPFEGLKTMALGQMNRRTVVDVITH